jgi:hypothetical protein
LNLIVSIIAVPQQLFGNRNATLRLFDKLT